MRLNSAARQFRNDFPRSFLFPTSQLLGCSQNVIVNLKCRPDTSDVIASDVKAQTAQRDGWFQALNNQLPGTP